MNDEQDWTDTEHVTGAVLAQLEDLDADTALEVIADVTATLRKRHDDVTPATVLIPGRLIADYCAGRITGWTFLPSAGVPGYMGPAAVLQEGPESLDVADEEGPFWAAVSDAIDEDGRIEVRWES